MGTIYAARFFKYVYAPLVLLIFLSSLASGFSRRNPAYNGIMQDYGAGWQYVYYSATDTESWVHNSNWCFTFKYDASGGNGTWRDVDKFGTLRSLAYDNYTKLPWEQSVNAGSGWSYSYSSGDWGYWNNGSATRFGYAYGAGQWFDSDKFNSWWRIGAANETADRPWVAPINLNNGWSYFYTPSDWGYWQIGSTVRFGYAYGAGQWYDNDKFNSWHGLGTANMSGARMYDGNPHSLGDGWSYYYSGDVAQWANGSVWRFGYAYGTGQWYDYDKFSTWRCLGAANVPSARPWVASVNLNNGWSYYYTTSDWGYWINGSAWRFGYSYAAGQWYDDDKFNIWWSLGAANLSAARLYDGSPHSLGNGWSYYYSGDVAQWADGSAWRFGYTYGTGQWSNLGSYGGWQTLGPGGLTAGFLGDGNWHTMDGIWSYQYVSGVGYLEDLSGLTKTWWPNRSGTWGWNSVYTTCDYTTETLGLYDSGNTSSVVQYTYSGGTPYKWVDFNYNISSKSETSQAIVFYTGSATHDVSSWLRWLPVNPNPGAITQTETWDFRNNDYANRYNHEVRAFANNFSGVQNGWVVQREQGSYGDCGIIASIDAFEAATGIYGGYTQTWLDTAIAKGWATGSPSDPGHYGSSGVDGNAYLMAFMGTTLGHAVTTSWNKYSLDQLATYLSQGYKVVVGLQLSYISEFGTSGGHAVDLLGFTSSPSYAEITNHWNIQSNQNQYIAGYDPTHAYPITLIPYSEFLNAYNAQGGYAAIVR